MQASEPELSQIIDPKYYQTEYKNDVVMKPRHIPGFDSSDSYKKCYGKLTQDYTNMFLD
jgi:hypothetical protein